MDWKLLLTEGTKTETVAVTKIDVLTEKQTDMVTDVTQIETMSNSKGRFKTEA